jgi:hypothetical protein
MLIFIIVHQGVKHIGDVLNPYMKTLAYPKDTNSYLKTTYNMKQGEQPPTEGTRQPKSFNPSFNTA